MKSSTKAFIATLLLALVVITLSFVYPTVGRIVAGLIIGWYSKDIVDHWFGVFMLVFGPDEEEEDNEDY